MLLQGSRCDWGPCCHVGQPVDRVSAGSSGELRDLYESPINRVQLSGASGLLIVSYEIQARVVVPPAPELSNDSAQFSAPQLCPCASVYGGFSCWCWFCSDKGRSRKAEVTQLHEHTLQTVCIVKSKLSSKVSFNHLLLKSTSCAFKVVRNQGRQTVTRGLGPAC